MEKLSDSSDLFRTNRRRNLTPALFRCSPDWQRISHEAHGPDKTGQVILQCLAVVYAVSLPASTLDI